MKFCTATRCPHYGQATKYPRKCYYAGPQCPRGWMDETIEILKLFFRRRREVLD